MSKKVPFVLNNDRVIFFDVDDTLIFWPRTWRKKGLDVAQFGLELGVEEYDEYKHVHEAPYTITIVPNFELIEFLKGLKAQGSGIVVWSHGGVRWAKTVVEALELTSYVDAVMAKPNLMVDDKKVDHLGSTVWSGPPDLIDNDK